MSDYMESLVKSGHSLHWV